MIDFPRDARGRELILLVERAKYERWVQQEVADLLQREYDRLADLLLSRTYRDLTRFQRRRIQQLFRALDRQIKAGYLNAVDVTTKHLQAYAKLEAEILHSQALASLPAGSVTTSAATYGLPKAYLEGIAKLPIQGLSLGEWFEGQAVTMSREARRIIQQGLIEGKNPLAIARRLTASARQETPALSRRAINEARAIARTAVNAVQNDAAMAAGGRLPRHISDSYRLLVVRDSRTSKICIALADRVFRWDDPNRMVPPFHISCRTSIQPILNGDDVAARPQANRPMSFKTYGDWLRTQPEGVQNKLLGPSRAGMWREGKLQLAELIDSDNRVLTVKELRARLADMSAAVRDERGDVAA